MSSVEQNKKAVAAFFEALNNNDMDTMLGLYHAEGSCWTSGKTLISGTMTVEQIAAGATAILEAFPKGLTFTVHAVTAEGDRVAVEAESLGEHASGVMYNNLYHFMFVMREGKVLQLKEYMDTELVTDILCGGQRP